VLHLAGAVEALDEGDSHAHLLLALLDGPVDGALDDLVPKVGHPQLVHAPHRLVELPLHVVLLHKRRHALLELLHRPPSPHTPHVHDPSAAVLLHQPLDERSNLRPPPLLHKPRRHKRHKPRRQHVIHNRPRNKVGKQRAHIRRVKRQVVDAPQRPDEPLKELLAPVHPRQPRQQQRRRLPLSAPLLQRNSYNPLHNHVPEPLLPEGSERVRGVSHVPRNKVLVDDGAHRLLELGDWQRQLQRPLDLLEDGLPLLLAYEGREVAEDGLRKDLVLEEVCHSRGGILPAPRHLGLRGVEPLEHQLQARLDLRGLNGPTDDEGGQEGVGPTPLSVSLSP